VPGFFGQKPTGVMPSYFIGLRAELEKAGATVEETAPPPIASSKERGEFLMKAIDAVRVKHHADKVVVIAHSQGGVDLRFALAKGGADRIAAIATLSSPHHGSGVADTALTWPTFLVHAALSAGATGMQFLQGDDVTAPDPTGSLETLSTQGMNKMGKELGAPTVPFFSVASISGDDTDGSCTGGAWSEPHIKDQLTPVLAPGRAMIRAAHGDVPNDGVVNSKSMRFANFLGCVPADHLDIEGWDNTSAFDQNAFVVELWRGLRDVARSGDERAGARVSR